MTVREWFRQMRRTPNGAALAMDMDRLLTQTLEIEAVYGVTLVRDLEAYEAWWRKQVLIARARLTE
jgi:hypothetical protein